MGYETDVATINNALRQVGEQLKEVPPKAKVDELQMRMQAAEQLLVKLEQGGGSGLFAGAGGPSIGARLLEGCEENPSFRALVDGNPGSARLKLATSIRAALTNEDGLTSSGDGIMPSQPDRRGVVGEVVRRLSLLAALPSRPTKSDSVEYVRMSSTGDAAEQEGEGAEKAEVDFAGELEKAPIVTIAAHTTASKQVLSDKVQLQAEIDRVMKHKVRARLENQIINGDGTANRIKGLLASSTAFIPTIGESAADVVGESLTVQANNGYSPNLIILNPLDWFRLSIQKTATEEAYLFGSPMRPLAPTIWNTTVVVTPSLAAGKAITLDTAFVTVLDREMASVLLSLSHKDYFTRNLVAILAELRAGLEVTDEGAVFEMDLPAASS